MMIRLRTILALAFLCLVPPLSPALATDWPKSDIPPDPAVTFGVLPNGMRYALMHNDTPTNAVSIRMRIGVRFEGRNSAGVCGDWVKQRQLLACPPST